MSRSFVLLLGCALVGSVACGGRLIDLESGLPADGGVGDGGSASDTGTSGVDTGIVASDTGVVASDTGPADVGPPPDPKTTCDTLVAAMCGDATGACCKASKFAWDPAGCQMGIQSWCGWEIDQVSSGAATYDASQLAACAKTWRDGMKSCNVNWLQWTKDYVACSHLFDGTKAPGESCSETAIDCKSPPGMSAYCDQMTHKCRAYGVVGAGQNCNYYGNVVRYCDVGLYCDVTDATPSCKPQKALGAACDGPEDFSCGWNNVCKDNKCAAGLPGGASCTDAMQCASYDCQMGKCSPTVYPVVSEGICTGSGGM